jgi:hypothetical protein
MSDEPLSEQLSKLPRRAIVAFAARCARRVQPLADNLPEEHRAAIDQGIAAAEAFARGDDNAEASADVAEVASGATAAAAGATGGPVRAAAAARAAEAAAMTIDATIWATMTAEANARATRTMGRKMGLPSGWAAAAAFDAAEATGDDSASTAIWAATRGDIERLLALGLGDPGTPGSPIDPSESGPLGPLWAEGEPAWFRNPGPAAPGAPTLESIEPDEADETPGLHSDLSPLTVYLDPGDAPQELIEEFYLTLSALYEAHGGSGLKFVKDEHRSLVPEEAER